MPEAIAVVDSNGLIVATNAAFRACCATFPVQFECRRLENEDGLIALIAGRPAGRRRRTPEARHGVST